MRLVQNKNGAWERRSLAEWMEPIVEISVALAALIVVCLVAASLVRGFIRGKVGQVVAERPYDTMSDTETRNYVDWVATVHGPVCGRVLTTRGIMLDPRGLMSPEE